MVANPNRPSLYLLYRASKSTLDIQDILNSDDVTEVQPEELNELDVDSELTDLVHLSGVPTSGIPKDFWQRFIQTCFRLVRRGASNPKFAACVKDAEVKFKTTRITECSHLSKWGGFRDLTQTMDEVDKLNKIGDTIWTLSAPTSLAIIALLIVRGIGGDSTARVNSLIHTNQILQYAGHAIDKYAFDKANPVFIGTRPNSHSVVPMTDALSELNDADFMTLRLPHLQEARTSMTPRRR
ncbi:hypothetical protein FSHL1_011752 [Fusarium sambucinum]